MFKDLFPAIIVLGIAYAIYKLFELYARRKERIMMIEKLSLGEGVVIPPDVTKWFSPPTPTPTSWALRVGLLLSGLGLGLGIAVIMHFCMGQFSGMDEWRSRNTWEILYFSMMMLFGGIGLTIAYLIEQKNRKKD